MLVLKGGQVYQDGAFKKQDIAINDHYISDIKEAITYDNAKIIDVSNLVIMPGFVDIHVHLREPGNTCKESIKNGSKACAKGGYTTVCTMPNLKPVPDSLKNLQVQLDIIKKDAWIKILPFASITKDELGESLSDMRDVADKVIGYSDDGKGVQSKKIMELAMDLALSLNKPLALHCEDESEVKGGYIHAGNYAKMHNHLGINSISEYGPIKREIELAKIKGTHIHICHISCRESVDLIRNAKTEGVNITCEVTPHHLLMNEEMLKEDGNYKMNPPLRSVSDQRALIEGLIDGTIDCIATDHAPHILEDKSKGLKGSAFGIIGIENAFSLLYTNLVMEKIISLELLIEKLTCGLKILDNKRLPQIKVGEMADLNVFDLNDKYIINDDEIISTSKNTPFKNMEVYATNRLTICNGEIVYEKWR